MARSANTINVTFMDYGRAHDQLIEMPHSYEGLVVAVLSLGVIQPWVDLVLTMVVHDSDVSPCGTVIVPTCSHTEFKRIMDAPFYPHKPVQLAVCCSFLRGHANCVPRDLVIKGVMAAGRSAVRDLLIDIQYAGDRSGFTPAQIATLVQRVSPAAPAAAPTAAPVVAPVGVASVTAEPLAPPPPPAAFRIEAFVEWVASTPDPDNQVARSRFFALYPGTSQEVIQMLLCSHVRMRMRKHIDASASALPDHTNEEAVRAFALAMPDWPAYLVDRGFLAQTAFMLAHLHDDTTAFVLEKAMLRDTRIASDMTDTDRQLVDLQHKRAGLLLVHAAYRAELVDARSWHVAALEKEAARIRLLLADARTQP